MTAVDAWQAELTARMAARRCACGAPATVFCPGTAPVRSEAASIPLSRGAATIELCLPCAAAAWPWSSEQAGRTRRPTSHTRRANLT